MTSSISKTDLLTWLEPLALRENLKRSTVSVTGTTEKGDGYMGDITFVKVEDENGKTYSLVVKSAKKSPLLREQLPVRMAYKNEIFLYTEVLKQFVNFQKEKNVKCVFDNYAKCYETLIYDDVEVVVLENMKDAGYFLWDKAVGMNRGHVVEVLKNYGKLHAISYALKDQKPELFHNLASKLPDIFIEMEQIFQDLQKKIFEEIIDLAKTKGYNDIAEKLVSMEEKISVIYKGDKENPYAIIAHGDCWNNNVMFKYKVNKKSSRIYLIEKKT